jgi:lytic murein transglycosylase
MRRRGAIGAIVCLAAACLAGGAAAAPCRTGGPYDKWLAEFEREAMAQGISQQAIAAAAPYLTYDQRIVNIDRGQRVFTQTFLEFSDRMAAAYRIQRGAALIKTYAPVFAKIDAQFGVPAPVIVSFWALESDFGANMGNYRTLSALASLAYDCRRADRFRAQLFDALRLIQRGDLRPPDMVGSWAGELGQTQMMPSEYYQYAVDYDGDGTRNLLRSAPDVLASTANYLVGLGWRRGEPWLSEVRVAASGSRHQTAARQMGGIRRYAGRRPAAAGRRFAGFAIVADGSLRTRFPRLRQFPRLSAVEQRFGLFHHGCLSCHPHCRRAAAPSRHCATATGVCRHQGIASKPGARRLRCRRNRWISRFEDPPGGQSDAGEIQPARGFLSHR